MNNFIDEWFDDQSISIDDLQLPVCYISIDKAYEDVGYEKYAFLEACRLSVSYGLDGFLLYCNRSVDSLIKRFGMETVEIADEKYCLVSQNVIQAVNAGL